MDRTLINTLLPPAAVRQVPSIVPGPAGWLAPLFHGQLLGLTEVEKAPSLAGRGGCWFRVFEGASVVAETHVGVESRFTPASKAHPGLVVESTAELEEIAARIRSAGLELSWEQRHSFEGYERFHGRDPFGNRVEVLATRTA